MTRAARGPNMAAAAPYLSCQPSGQAAPFIFPIHAANAST
jgi:hypothetical protein